MVSASAKIQMATKVSIRNVDSPHFSMRRKVAKLPAFICRPDQNNHQREHYFLGKLTSGKWAIFAVFRVRVPQHERFCDALDL